MDTKILIKHVMEDQEVIGSMANSYQIAQIVACVLEFIRNQPERSKREDRKLCEACLVNYFDPNCECGALNTTVTS